VKFNGDGGVQKEGVLLNVVASFEETPCARTVQPGSPGRLMKVSEEINEHAARLLVKPVGHGLQTARIHLRLAVGGRLGETCSPPLVHRLFLHFSCSLLFKSVFLPGAKDSDRSQ
jgi:hypothetical protein